MSRSRSRRALLTAFALIALTPLLGGADCIGMVDEGCSVDRQTPCVNKQDYADWAAEDDSGAPQADWAMACPTSDQAERYLHDEEPGDYRLMRELSPPSDQGDECCYDFEVGYGACE